MARFCAGRRHRGRRGHGREARCDPGRSARGRADPRVHHAGHHRRHGGRRVRDARRGRRRGRRHRSDGRAAPRRAGDPRAGGATGVLTAALTERADDVLGTDLAAAALERARRRAPSARFALAAFPGEWPEGRRDLVVLSEVGYYLSPDDLDRTVDRVLDTLDDDGVLVACHWRHPDDHAVSDGDTVHAAIARRWPRPALVQHVEPDFVLTVFPGAAVTSVARAEGLVG